MAESEYIPKAKTVTIEATSRISIKIPNPDIGDIYTTFEYTEARSIPDIDGVDIEAEKRALWDAVITQTDDQAEEASRVLSQGSDSKK